MSGLLDPDFIVGAMFGASTWSLALILMGKWPWTRTPNTDTKAE